MPDDRAEDDRRMDTKADLYYIIQYATELRAAVDKDWPVAGHSVVHASRMKELADRVAARVLPPDEHQQG